MRKGSGPPKGGLSGRIGQRSFGMPPRSLQYGNINVEWVRPWKNTNQKGSMGAMATSTLTGSTKSLTWKKNTTGTVKGAATVAEVKDTGGKIAPTAMSGRKKTSENIKNVEEVKYFTPYYPNLGTARESIRVKGRLRQNLAYWEKIWGQ